MGSGEGLGSIRVVEHQAGKVLRLQTAGTYAMDIAIGLLGFLESELEAEISSKGDYAKFGLTVAQPIPVRLEGLDVEVTTDGSELEIRRVGGSKGEFEDLCEFITTEYIDA